MYLNHFAFTRLPFEHDLAPDELFAYAASAEAETRLHHLLELQGIGLLTGEVGSGKTTVCRKVTAALHTGLYRVFYVSLSTGHVMDMYKSIAWELGLPPSATAPAPTALSEAKSHASPSSSSNGPCSSSTKRTICVTTSLKICAAA